MVKHDSGGQSEDTKNSRKRGGLLRAHYYNPGLETPGLLSRRKKKEGVVKEGIEKGGGTKKKGS